VVYRHGEANTFAVSINVRCQHLDRLAGIFHGTNFQFAQPDVLCGGASHS
jgi:hypothetical protein